MENAIRQLEDATRLVSELNMFSKNESFEEIATTDLMYVQLHCISILTIQVGNITTVLILFLYAWFEESKMINWVG